MTLMDVDSSGELSTLYSLIQSMTHAALQNWPSWDHNLLSKENKRDLSYFSSVVLE